MAGLTELPGRGPEPTAPDKGTPLRETVTDRKTDVRPIPARTGGREKQSERERERNKQHTSQIYEHSDDMH